MDKNQPLEIERKYLIGFPDLALLEQAQGYGKTEITQTYLKSQSTEFGSRVRKRGAGGIYTYTKTYKRNISMIRRIEIEEEITKEECEALLKEADPALKTISKVRHCFYYEGKLFELDIYPFWNDRATLEIELSDESEPFALPPFLHIIREVTEDRRYRNRSLAQSVITEAL